MFTIQNTLWHCEPRAYVVNECIICYFPFHFCCACKSIDIRNYDCRRGNLIENNHDARADSPNSAMHPMLSDSEVLHTVLVAVVAGKRYKQTINLCASLSRMIGMCLMQRSHFVLFAIIWKSHRSSVKMWWKTKMVYRWQHSIVCCRCDEGSAMWHSLDDFAK